MKGKVGLTTNGEELRMVARLYAAALDAKAENIVVLDVRGLSGFTDFFIIASGRSTRHVQGIAAALDKQVNNKRLTNAKVEGLDEGRWVLLDFNDVVAHVFYDEARQFYDLEGLWKEAPRLDPASLNLEQKDSK